MFITYHIPVFSIKVDNLDTDVTEQDLFTFFSSYGAIQSVRVMRNKYQQADYGFVNFFKHFAAKSAFEKCVGKVIKSNVIRLMFEGQKQNKIDYPAEANLMIKNLDYEVCEKSLQNHFRKLGNISSVAIVRDDEGFSTGRGYVQYTKVEDAAKAYMKLDGSYIGTRAIVVHCLDALKDFIKKEASKRKSETIKKQDEEIMRKINENLQ
jgi:polyadenylate-binding protein